MLRERKPLDRHSHIYRADRASIPEGEIRTYLLTRAGGYTLQCTRTQGAPEVVMGASSDRY